MKPLDYQRKYNLTQGVNFSHNDFVADLTQDFLTLLEVGNSFKNLKGFENAVRAIRMKWDGINKKTAGNLPDKLWNYFYASVIAKMREELFPNEMEKLRREKEESKRRREEYRRWEEQELFGGWNPFDYFSFLLGILKSQTIPTSSFEFLNLELNATQDDVKKRYRELAVVYHPDKGGNNDKFIELTEAKNKCLAYIN